MALISAVLVMMVVTVLGIGAIAMANHSLNTTVINRKQVQSIGGAEAGIDLAINAIQSPTPPCNL
jgi:type II secretory pathway component PulK